jgi:hypothetical protein
MVAILLSCVTIIVWFSSLYFHCGCYSDKCWDGRRKDGHQQALVWGLQICTVLWIRSGRMVTSFDWDW